MKGSFAFEQRVVSLSLVSFLDIARRTLSITGRFPSDPHRGLSSAFDIVRIHTGDMARPDMTGNGLNRALVVTNLYQQHLIMPGWAKAPSPSAAARRAERVRRTMPKGADSDASAARPKQAAQSGCSSAVGQATLSVSFRMEGCLVRYSCPADNRLPRLARGRTARLHRRYGRLARQPAGLTTLSRAPSPSIPHPAAGSASSASRMAAAGQC
jgi:hypothetical protein